MLSYPTRSGDTLRTIPLLEVKYAVGGVVGRGVVSKSIDLGGPVGEIG